MRLAVLSLAGTSIEWYDFFLYGVGAALVFPALFFPRTLPHSVALLASFSTFAVGFLARPVGALAFGHIGDRIGRKSALAIALVLMGAATTLIACLPSYAAIGPAAPVMLIGLRLAQGIAIGGQWGGAMLLVVESAPRRRRGFYGSFAQVGVPTGVVLANLAFLAAGSLTSGDDFLAWGWRFPFLLSIALVALGLYVHFRVEETPVYRHYARERLSIEGSKQASPTLQALRQHPREMLLAIGSQIAPGLCFYVCITYVIAYGTDADGLHLSRQTMLSAVLIGSAAMAPMLILTGELSDRFGRRSIFLLGAALSAVSAFALFALLATKSLLWMSLGIGLNLCTSACMYGPLAALFSELFRTNVRYSGVSFAYQTAGILGGGFAPLVATALTSSLHSSIGVSAYMAAACAVSFAAVAAARETAGDDLDEKAGPGRP
jgi:MFS family permease